MNLPPEEIQSRLESVYVGRVPHNRALGLTVHSFAKNRLALLLPYRADLVGNPETGVLHGGCITASIDAACGGAVILALAEPRRVATLDLRIDYLRPGKPPLDIVCEAECYKVTRHIGFVRAWAYDDTVEDPVATASGTFAIFAKSAKGAREVKS